jgi:hypothetical protein
MLMRLVFPLLLLAIGCGGRPIKVVEDDVGQPPPRDLTLISADGGTWDSAPGRLDMKRPSSDFTPTGVYTKLGYHRVANTGGWAPTFMDAKLAEGTLTLSDWGLAQPPIFCEAMLTSLQQLDLLKAAEDVDWNMVNSLKEVGCPVKPDGATWKAVFNLTRGGGDTLLVETSACNDVKGYPPPDLETFLKLIYQVEKDACETP